MAKIKLPEDIAEKYTVAKKVAAVFICPKLGGITIDLAKIKMPLADKLAALKPPMLIAKEKKSSGK